MVYDSRKNTLGQPVEKLKESWLKKQTNKKKPVSLKINMNQGVAR